MNTKRTVFVLIPFAVLAGSLFSRSGGTLPGSSSIPLDSAQRAPSCTACHSGTIGGSGVAVHMTATQRSLAASESVQVTLQVTGGPSSTDGGFVAENTAGAFAAVSNTTINTSGRAGQFITHSNSGRRTWTFPFAAPTAPGLVMLYGVGMAANGNGGRSGDVIAFNGYDPTATDSTPVYIGVNAAGNRRFGQGCVGSYGNWPVLYSDVSPTVGNAGYVVRLAGAAPNATSLFLFGLPRTAPLDLGLIGAAGCSMWVDAFVSLATVTGAGNAQRGEGTASVGLGIPNAPATRGAILACQAAIVDPANGRSLPLTVTDGLLIQIQ